ncbi:hypothetical protein GMMP15_50038 [Candidatus Magnetomoraceae bacterium gMMP-15]
MFEELNIFIIFSALAVQHSEIVNKYSKIFSKSRDLRRKKKGKFWLDYPMYLQQNNV